MMASTYLEVTDVQRALLTILAIAVYPAPNFRRLKAREALNQLLAMHRLAADSKTAA